MNKNIKVLNLEEMQTIFGGQKDNDFNEIEETAIFLIPLFFVGFGIASYLYRINLKNDVINILDKEGEKGIDPLSINDIIDLGIKIEEKTIVRIQNIISSTRAEFVDKFIIEKEKREKAFKKSIIIGLGDINKDIFVKTQKLMGEHLNAEGIKCDEMSEEQRSNLYEAGINHALNCKEDLYRNVFSKVFSSRLFMAINLVFCIGAIGVGCYNYSKIQLFN